MTKKQTNIRNKKLYSDTYCELLHNERCDFRINIYTEQQNGQTATHIFMFHVLEQPQLSVRSLGVDDGLKWPRELLYGHLFTTLHVI